MSSTTINYEAKAGDTVERIAAATGIKASELLALNPELQTASSQMTPKRLYKLPRSAANDSAAALSDLIVEFHARKTEANKAA